MSLLLQPHETWRIIDSSKIMEFMTCERKTFYRYILGWISIYPNRDLVYGESWHRAKRTLFLEGFSKVAQEHAYEAFLDYYRQFFPEITDLDHQSKFPGNAKKGIESYCRQYQYEEFTHIATEVSFPTPIDEEGNVIWGKLDSISRDRYDKYLSVEHKTGSREDSWWYNQWIQRFQIGTYYHALASQYSWRDVRGIIVDGSIFLTKEVKHLRGEIKKTIGQLEDWLFQAKYFRSQYLLHLQMVQEICSVEEKVMPAFPKRTISCIHYSKLCPYFHVCSAWENPLQHINQIPAEMEVSFWDPRKQDKHGARFDAFLDPYERKLKRVQKERSKINDKR